MKPDLRHISLILGCAILLFWLGDRFVFTRGKSLPEAPIEPSPGSRIDSSTAQKNGANPLAHRLGRRVEGSPSNGGEPVQPGLIAQIQVEIRKCPDPAAEKLLEVFQEVGVPEAEQVRQFWHTYNQLTRIDYHDELIAEDRLATRTTLQEVATNSTYSAEARRQSRLASEELRASFEAHLRKQQADMLNEVLRNLGNTRFPTEELRRRLLEIHPHLPIEGPLTNLLTPPPATLPAPEKD